LHLDHASNRLYTIMGKRLNDEQTRCDELFTQLQYNYPEDRVQIQEQRLHFTTEKLIYLSRKKLTDKESRLGRQAALLDAVSPLATMARGYSISSRIDPGSGRKTFLRDSKQVKKDEHVEIRLHKGRIECEVLEVKE